MLIKKKIKQTFPLTLFSLISSGKHRVIVEKESVLKLYIKTKPKLIKNASNETHHQQQNEHNLYQISIESI